MENNLIKELKKYRSWVDWKLIDGRKIPINPRTGKAASSTDPETWSEFDEVGLKSPNRGFVLSDEDPFTCVDIDHCLTPTGIVDGQQNWEMSEKAVKIVAFFDSYTEVSPSGTGLHIWVKGKIPAAIKRSDFEIYSTKRYITITENPLFNSEIQDRQKQIDAIYAKYGQDRQKQLDAIYAKYGQEKGEIQEMDLDAESEKKCIEELRNVYRKSRRMRDIWNYKLDFVKADGESPDESCYDLALANLLRNWSAEKILWALKFRRAQLGVKPKHNKALILTISKVKQGIED